MRDAAADAVEQEAEVRVFEDRAVPRRGQPLDVRGGVLVGGPARTEARVTYLTRCLAELGGIRQLGGVVEVFGEAEGGIEAFEETAEPRYVGSRPRQHHDAWSLEVRGSRFRVIYR